MSVLLQPHTAHDTVNNKAVVPQLWCVAQSPGELITITKARLAEIGWSEDLCIFAQFFR